MWESALKKNKMADPSRSRLKRTTALYWILLIYIIAALIWWALSLLQQNAEIYRLRLELINATENSSPDLATITDARKRAIAKYVGEGATFLLLILVGAAFIYRSVRKQLRLQQQQQNFVMAVTHELKTPIAVSRLNLETLQRHNLQPAQQEKLLKVALQETLRLDTLINNILISSQLDGNSYKISREELNLSELVHTAANQFKARYPDRNLQTSVEDDIHLNGDPLLINLLLSNLLENANKYSPRETAIQVLLQKKEGKINLSVMDEGEGIEPEEKEKVFDKFYRIGSETVRKAQGTGLGLYLCKKIVTDHKGTIRIKDNNPRGSIFIVQLPGRLK